MYLDIRKIDGNGVSEVYLSVAPSVSDSAVDQANEMFSAVKQSLNDNNARILQERVFGTGEALTTAKSIRKQIYGDLDDGVEPAWLEVLAGIKGPISGIQIHAVAGAGAPETVALNGSPCGRIFSAGGRKFLAVSALTGDAGANPSEQADQMLHKSEAILKQVGGDFLSVPRTWMWLEDILDWYGDFNAVRNAFFINRGMIGKGMVSKMPASTGIGIGPVGERKCTIDFTAVIEPENGLEYLDVGGNQHSAYDYGSAFSRGSTAITPAGETCYVSGTASIDEDGHTTNLDDAEAQIEETIDNIVAVLKELGCTESDLVHTLVYCKTAEIEKLFCEKYPDFDWPHITMITDVCRGDLLFEIEATAMKQ